MFLEEAQTLATTMAEGVLAVQLPCTMVVLCLAAVSQTLVQAA